MRAHKFFYFSHNLFKLSRAVSAVFRMPVVRDEPVSSTGTLLWCNPFHTSVASAVSCRPQTNTGLARGNVSHQYCHHNLSKGVIT